MKLTKIRRVCYALVNLPFDILEEHFNVVAIIFGIIFLCWFKSACDYRTLPVHEVNRATNEVVIEYRDNLYSAYVDEDLLDIYEEQGYAKVTMKSVQCWDFSLCPELDKIESIQTGNWHYDL